MTSPRRLVVLLLMALLPLPSTLGRDLTVRVRTRSETILAGQGVDVFVDVAARDKRPRLEPPTIPGARVWIAEETFRPAGMSAIGGIAFSDNVFTTRLRLVAESPGPIVVPPIVAAIDGRSGRGQPLRLIAEAPPIAGRPPGFLGGVGDFAARAEVSPPRVRVGEEAIYRIRVEGPGAWGMTTRPSPDRLRALAINPRVSERPDEVVDEPPSRTFVLRIRPMKAGEVVLPPIAIASYDPRSRRYLTRATNGVRFEVVETPALAADALDYAPPPAPASRARIAGTVAAALVVAGVAGTVRCRRRIARWIGARFPGSRREARRFARRFARGPIVGDGDPEATAGAILAALVEYARLGADRPPGALTPAEARASVATASGSDLLGERAAAMAARCDRILFAARETGGGPNEENRLELDARELFEALGRSGGRGLGVSGRSGW